MTTDVDVAVIGAGIAGLTATRALNQAGYRVVCIEARDRIGGRAVSQHVAGMTIDLGATWFWHNEQLIAKLTDQLQVDTFAQALAGDAMFEPPERPAQRLHGNPIDAPAMRLTNGTQGLAHALAQDLDATQQLLNSRVTAIHHDRDSVTVQTAEEAWTSRQVIIALPPALAVASIEFSPGLPPEIAAAATSTAVWMGDMVKAVAVYEQPFWRAERLAGSAISYRGPFREFHDHSGPAADGPGALFGFAPAQALPQANNDDIAAAFAHQLVRIFGSAAADPQHVAVTNWATERYTTPPRSVQGGTGMGNRIFSQPTAQRIHWASTETADAFAGHIERAIRAGLTVAHNITKTNLS